MVPVVVLLKPVAFDDCFMTGCCKGKNAHNYPNISHYQVVAVDGHCQNASDGRTDK